MLDFIKGWVAKIGYWLWGLARPKSVRRLMRKFTPGDSLEIHGQQYWLLGFTEGQDLIVSQVNPSEDYDGALASREHVCADHFD